MNCSDCKLKNRMETAENDIKELQQAQNDHSVNIGTIDTTLKHIREILEDVKRKVDKLTEAPTKRYDTIVNTSLAGVTAAVIAAVMSLIIMGK